MLILKIILFLILLAIAFKFIAIVGWLFKVAILVFLIGTVVWLAQEVFGKKSKTSD